MHPTAAWIIQQLREAFAYDAVPRYLIFDNDKKYGSEVLAVIDHRDIRRKQITPRSQWQNGVAERWVDTVRRDLLDKGAPSIRAVTPKPNRDGGYARFLIRDDSRFRVVLRSLGPWVQGEEPGRAAESSGLLEKNVPCRPRSAYFLFQSACVD